MRALFGPVPLPARTRSTALLVIPLVALACCLFAAVGWIQSGQPGRQFGEGRIGTLLSVGVLAASGLVALKVSFLPAARSMRKFWCVFASLLLFAAADDMFKLHEQLDVVINRALGTDPDDPVFDRIDDVIVLAYAALGCGTLGLMYMRRLLALIWMVRFFIAGGLCFLAMVAGDMLRIGTAIEESLKLLAGAWIFSGVAAAEHQLAEAPDRLWWTAMAPPGLEPGCPLPDRGF